eukprot:GHVP01001401.1.p1 GENE.GHVP01001401.1~~GHVP01001401.1.p1  ORF type:complete len:435 (-),score=76.64 GHVP01001401.1:69-1373(-)
MKKEKRILVASGAQILLKAVDNATFEVITDLVDRELDFPPQVDTGFVYCSNDKVFNHEIATPILLISSSKKPKSEELRFGEQRIKSILPKLEELFSKTSDSNSSLEGILKEFEKINWTLDIKFLRQNPRNFYYLDEMSTTVNLVRANNTWIPLYDFGWDKLFSLGETGKPLFSVNPQEKKVEMDVFLDEKFQNPVIGGHPTNGLLSKKKLDLVKQMVMFAKKKVPADLDHVKGYLEDPALMDDYVLTDNNPVSEGNLVMQYMFYGDNTPEYFIMQEKQQAKSPENFQHVVKDQDPLKGVPAGEKLNEAALLARSDIQESFGSEISQSNAYLPVPNSAVQTHNTMHHHQYSNKLLYNNVPELGSNTPSVKKTDQSFGFARVSAKQYLMVMASVTALLYCLSMAAVGYEESNGVQGDLSNQQAQQKVKKQKAKLTP